MAATHGGELVLRFTPGRRRRHWIAVFLAGELTALVLVVSGWIGHVLPSGLAVQVSHNSEAFLLAAVVTLQVTWLRGPVADGPDDRRGAGPAVVVAGVSLALMALGAFLLTVDEPRIRTLNEAVFASALLFPYCAVRPRRPAFALVSLVVLVLVVAFFDTALVRQQAECLVALVLAPWGFDVFVRRTLAPLAHQRAVTAWTWTAFLVLAPVVLMALQRWGRGSALDGAIEYAARGAEGFWGLAAVYAAVLLAWPGGPARTTVGR